MQAASSSRCPNRTLKTEKRFNMEGTKGMAFNTTALYIFDLIVTSIFYIFLCGVSAFLLLKLYF